MSGRPEDSRNTILPRDNSAAPSLVLYDADKDNPAAISSSINRNSSAANPNQLANNNSLFHPDNEDPPTGPDRIQTTTGNLLTNTNNDISLLNNTDNQLMNASVGGAAQQRKTAGSDNQSFEASLPARRPSGRDLRVSMVPAQVLSPIMACLKAAITDDSPQQLINLATKSKIDDPEEALMLMYVAVAFMNTPQVFKVLIDKHQGFKTKPVWHVLFSSPSIFHMLQSSPTMVERQKFDEIVLKVALERDLHFITEAVLDRAVITPQLISLLLQDSQQERIIGMLTRDFPPDFLSDNLAIGAQKKKSEQKISTMRKGRQESLVTKKLNFIDVVEAMIDLGTHTNAEIVEMIGLMKNKVDEGKPPGLLNFEDLFKLFVVKRKIKLLRYLFSQDRKVFDFRAELFLKALELEAYDMAALLFKEFFRLLRNMTSQESEFAVSQIVSSYNRANGMIDFKAYLVRQFSEQMQLRHARALLDAIRNKVKTVSKQNILVMNLNVVKTACLLIENLTDIGQKFNQLQVRCRKLRCEIIELTKEYMTRVDSEYEMKYLLLEKDFEYRDSLDLITKHKIVEFLESQLAENVVREIWRSAYATSDSILSASTNHALTFKFWDCVRDLEYDQPFFRVKDVSKIEAHIFQFTVWRFSPKARMLQEFFVTLLFTFLIDSVINSFFTMIPELAEFENQLFDMEDQLSAISNSSSIEYQKLEGRIVAFQFYFEPLRLQFYDALMPLTYIFFAVLFFAIQHIPEIIYTTIMRRQFEAYSFKNLLDFSLFFLFFTFICVSYGNNLNGSWKEQLTIGEQTRADVYTRNFFAGYPKFEELLLILCIAGMWFRLFYLFIYNTMFGTLVGIISRLLPTLLSYIVFYFFEVILFSLISELAFRRLQLYNTFENAFYTLFYAGFGFFSYNDFKEETQFGYGFGMLFILAFLVANLGLITSIFTSTIMVLYDEFYKHKSVFTMIETLRVRPIMQADKEYSALISLPPPLNGLLLFLAPFLMTTKSPEFLNKAILWIAYLPLLILTFVVFTLYNFALLPVTYVKMFFHKMIMIFVYSKSYRVSRADKFMLWILFAAIGPFRLLSNVFVDLYAFLQHCTLQELPKTRVQIREKPLAKQNIKMATNYFKQRNERLVMYKQAAGELRDQMSIFQKIGQIFIPQPLINFMTNQRASMDTGPSNLLSEKEFETVYTEIREYSTIKQILQSNSEKIIFNKQRVKAVDCQIMSVLMMDVLRHKTVSKVEDENFIFIRRAMDVKTRAQMDRRADEQANLGSDVALYVKQPMTNADLEDRYKSDKRMKHAIRKLTNLNTSRMLSILGYSTTEKDVRRLEYAIKSFGSENANLQRKLTQMSMLSARGGAGSGEDPLRSFFGPDNGKVLEDRISMLGMGIPKLDNDLQSMQQEIQVLVEHYAEANKLAQGAKSREMKQSNTIENLHKEMNVLRQGQNLNQSNAIDNFIQHDYFYQNENNDRMKSKVSFADGHGNADTVDQFMNERPNRQQVMMNSEAQPIRRTFVTQNTLRKSGVQDTQTQAQRQQSEQKKQKVISLAQLKKFGKQKSKQLKASQASNVEPQGLFSKPGEDSDVPYISDNSAM